ncbi:unnamed protein product [Parajaminaea phylloscopi]
MILPILWIVFAGLRLGVKADPLLNLTAYETTAFTLQLEDQSQVATALTFHAGKNAGTTDFNFLLQQLNDTLEGLLVSISDILLTELRLYILNARSSGLTSDDKVLGDLQLQLRRVGGPPQWLNYSTHWNRTRVEPLEHVGLARADISKTLHLDIPLRVVRTWDVEDDSLTLTFEVQNTDKAGALEVGGIGIPLSYNNDWSAVQANDAPLVWNGYVSSDPALSLDAGYVVTKRLNGQAPTLLTIPIGQTPLEQWRPNYDFGGLPDIYPKQWRSQRIMSFSFEAIFSWWTHSWSPHLVDRDVASADDFLLQAPDNTPSSLLLSPGETRIFGLRLFTAGEPSHVESRLRDKHHPTVVGLPGFVVSQEADITLVINSTSTPYIIGVEPPFIQFRAPPARSASDSYRFTGKVAPKAFGKCRVTYVFGDGKRGTLHYTIIRSHEGQLASMGRFLFERQYFNQTEDYFKRAPSIITFDHQEMQQVVDDPRPWVAGLSDEAGAGSYLAAAVKQFAMPDASEVRKLEDFVTKTLWGQVQDPRPNSPTYAAVKKSIFYWDPKLPNVKYDPAVYHDPGFTWNKTSADQIHRSYNYMHPHTVYYVLYHLARNYEGLTRQSWTWYLDRAYDTIMALKQYAGIDGYGQYGLMEGSYMALTLASLQREGQVNATLKERAAKVERFMRERTDLWARREYPLESEDTWDNTAQEEVFVWSRWYGHAERRRQTVETVLGCMSSLPHWGYSGASLSYWDFSYAGKFSNGSRQERILHHYKGAQGAFVLLEEFLARPDEIYLLRAGYGGVLGPLSTILEDGFTSTGFHSWPDYLNWDPLSGDNGVAMALYTLSARSVVVHDPTVGGWAGFGAKVELNGSVLHITPDDGIRQRLFIASIALYAVLDSGKFRSATYDTASHEVTITLDAATAHAPKARLRLETTAHTATSASYTTAPQETTSERGALVIQLSKDFPTTLVLTRR